MEFPGIDRSVSDRYPGGDTSTDGNPMSDTTPPPVPRQDPADAARQAPAAPAVDDIDDTGTPAPLGDVAAVGRGFVSALFDISFRTFITRRLAGAFYVVGLVAIAIAFLVCFIGGIVRGALAIGFTPGAGITLILATVILVPIATFIAIVVLRLVIESVVALIAIAENTQRTADNTRR
jgi:hypothetical protein